MKIVITTVGTSIFTNYQKQEVRDALDNDYRGIDDDFKKLENKPESEYDPENSSFQTIKERIEEYWLKGIEKKDGEWNIENDKINYDASAEIKSIRAIQKEANSEIKVYFLATDTVLSHLASQLNQTFFENEKNIKFSENCILVIKGLQINNREEFEEKGLPNLVSEIKRIKESYPKDEIILNLTGGYKATLPFLTIIGQLYDIEINYIYENSDELITIPSLPIQFDWTKAERFYDYLKNDNESSFDNDEQEIIDELKEFQLIKILNQNKYEVSALGKLFQDYIKNNLEIAQDVMGFFMEYKLLEYYIKHPYKNEYNHVERSMPIKINENRKSEIDLILRKTKEDNEFIAVESKSYWGVQSVRNQIEKQIVILKELNLLPEEYILVFYVDENNKRFQPLGRLKDFLLDIKNMFYTEMPSCKFKAYYFEVLFKSDTRTPNPYKKFMSNKKVELKKYNLE